MLRASLVFLLVLFLSGKGFAADSTLANTLEAIQQRVAVINNVKKADIEPFIAQLHELSEKETVEKLRKDIDDMYNSSDNEAWGQYLGILISAAEYFPDDLIAKYALAYMYLRAGGYDDCYAILKEIQKVRPDFPYLTRSLGYIFMKMDRDDEALKIYEDLAKHIDQQPRETHARIFINLGELYGKKKDSAKSMESYRKALELTEAPYETGSILARLGDISLEMEDYTQCVDSFNQAIKVNPDEAFNYQNASICYQSLEQWQTAVDYGIKAVVLKKYPAGHLTLANAYCGLGQYEEAIVQYRAALKIMPEYWSAWVSLGQAYENMKEYAQAKEAYLKANKLKADDAPTLRKLGFTSFKLHEIEEAVTYLERSLVIDPGYAEAVKNLEGIRKILPEYYRHKGQVHAANKEYAQAKEVFNKLLSIEPENHTAFFYLHLITYEADKDYDKALVLINKALELKPDDPGYLYHQGTTYQHLGLHDKAIECYKKVLRLSSAEDTFGGELKRIISEYEKNGPNGLCVAEVKACSGGLLVSRAGDQCDFKKCPEEE